MLWNERITLEPGKRSGKPCIRITIVTKDSDFNDLVSFFGFPPKVIRIRRGNCSSTDIKKLIESSLD